MPSVLETLPTQQVSSGVQAIDSQSRLDEFLHASYLFETARFANTKVIFPSYLYGRPARILDSTKLDYQDKQQVFDPIFAKYGVRGREGYYEWRTVLSDVLKIPQSSVVLKYPFAEVRGSDQDPFVLGFSNVYGLNYTQESRFKADILGGSSQWYAPRSRGSGGFGDLFSRVFSLGTIRTFVENPISAVTGIIDRFSDPVGTNTSQFLKGGFDAPRVSPVKLGLESGINTVANIGFAFGVQGVQQGITAGVAASTSLPAGTAGPVSPGFWSSIGSGNFGHAGTIAKNTLGVATGGPSTFLSRQGSNLLLQEGGQTLIKFTGDIGRGILQALTLDFNGLARTIGLTATPGPSPGSSQLLFGPTGSSGGSGGGGGFLPSQNTGQSTVNSVILPVMGMSLVLVTLWYFLRKKA